MKKEYRPAEIEGQHYARWEKAGYFAPHGSGVPYSIVIPPPNVTGTLHMGHALQDTVMDALTRYHRNAVVRQIDRDEPDCDGIVEERIGRLEDLAPERFYLGERAQERALESLARYVDPAAGGLNCGLMDEYIVTRPAWL